MQDVVGHALWVVMWFIASTVWAAGFNKLEGDVGSHIRDFLNTTIQCISRPDTNDYNIIRDDYAQAAIAAVSDFYTRL